MARYRSRHERERSKRLWWGLTKFGLLLGLVGAAAYYAHDYGQRRSSQEISGLRAEVSRLAAVEQDQRERATRLETALADAEKRADEYRQRYEDLAPEPLRAIIDEAKAKLASGLSAKRLAFAVSQAQEPRECAPAETRRFLARTPNYDGPDTWVRFNNLIVVSATGQAAGGGREQWFDPTGDVSLTFTPLGGKPQTVSGRLPIQHAFVFKDKEYRFAAAPGARGFIEVTADWCEATT